MLTEFMRTTQCNSRRRHDFTLRLHIHHPTQCDRINLTLSLRKDTDVRGADVRRTGNVGREEQYR